MLKGTGAAAAAAADAAASAHTNPSTRVKKKENEKRKRCTKHSARKSRAVKPRSSARAVSTAAGAQLEEEEESAEGEEEEEEQASLTGSDGEGAADDDDDDDDHDNHNGDELNERWTASCADGFAGLLQRYPFLLKPALRCNGLAAEMQLRGGAAAAAGAAVDDTALSCAMTIYGIPAPSPISMVAMHSELAAAWVKPHVRGSATPTYKDGCVKPTQVREQQEQQQQRSESWQTVSLGQTSRICTCSPSLSLVP
jgi:hypothetical protein